MSRTKSLRFDLPVDKSLMNYEASTKSLIYIDPEQMEQHGVETGDTVRVSTYWGKTVWGRVAPPLEEDRGSGVIRLDRFQRQTMKAKLSEVVEIYPEQAESVERIYLQPAVDLGRASSHHLEEHLKEQFVEDQTIVVDGAILFARFHHSVAGVTYFVRKTEPGPGIVTEETEIVLEPPKEGASNDNRLDVTFEDVGGFSKELEIVREYVQIPLQQPELYRQLGIRPPRGLIFYGPPGTGKTHLARAISNELNASYFYINGPSIVGSTYGETEANLRKIFGEATHHAPSIIMIDEIDVIAPKRGETGSHSDARAVTQLLTLMDGLNAVEGVVVIGTTNRVDSLDEALRRPGRFDRELYFGPPDAPDRREILKIHSREMPLTHAAEHALNEIADSAAGYVGADLMELCREAGLSALRRAIDQKKDTSSFIKPREIHVDTVDFKAALTKVKPSASRFVLARTSNHKLADVAGFDAQKDRLRQLIIEPLRNPEVLQEYDLKVPEAVLLHGPSGTGKTHLASAIAGECGANFVAVDGPELFTKWLGESEESVRHIFALARRLAPTVLFFDQLDALAPRRSSDSGSRTTERVINQLLAELDDLQDHPAQIAVIAATNRIDLVDPSVMRSGRIGVKLELPLPNETDRVRVAEWMLRRLSFPASSEAELEALHTISAEMAHRTEGKVPVDLMAICREAKRMVTAERKTGENIAGEAVFWKEAVRTLLTKHNL